MKNHPKFTMLGFSPPKTLHGVYFKNHAKATIPHELFHAMDIMHTFESIFPEAEFTYQQYCTDNIMDYIRLNDKSEEIERKTLFLWQMKRLNNKLNS